MRILAFAYACEPGRGSEPTAGWCWARMLARLGETWVITRASNREAIEQELKASGPIADLHFVYVDLPPHLRRWKRGQRGVRLYYLLWQRAALHEARTLDRTQRFDVVWHLTLANAWIGSTACLLGRPFVYGPVGGGVGTPWRLTRALGAEDSPMNEFRLTARISGRYLNPLARMSLAPGRAGSRPKRRDIRLAASSSSVEGRVFPNVVLDRLPDATPACRLTA